MSEEYYQIAEKRIALTHRKRGVARRQAFAASSGKLLKTLSYLSGCQIAPEWSAAAMLQAVDCRPIIIIIGSRLSNSRCDARLL